MKSINRFIASAKEHCAKRDDAFVDMGTAGAVVSFIGFGFFGLASLCALPGGHTEEDRNFITKAVLFNLVLAGTLIVLGTHMMSAAEQAVAYIPIFDTTVSRIDINSAQDTCPTAALYAKLCD
ncbi:MAG: hypothetical protein FWE93_03610 [Alphaproteobacteria bacterium]|nr:hypothetical protein [Alphaproteobacteria bacterium]